ncbi:MAG: hemerythrin family protein [Helicobacter sp.]|uniref:bacteriohemerythrin n=1 Tax=Helicobacter sp. TaxID=218 RepID=UPI0023C422BD|nr:hemerythrin family protein [Helicobacter sp.]MDE5925168.1 hemerythrin family protein [Helicobacter sp.]MDE7176029.1 hemerythrin family protein [Helicobacter sp.]
MLPTWSKEISVHNEKIDEQHKKLFEIAGRAYMMTEKKSSKEEVIGVLRELLEYTKEHFKDEEEYMQSISFPRLEAHRVIHQDIIRDMVSAVTRVQNLNDLKDEIAKIAKNWLLVHIIKEDMQIEKFRRNTCPLPIKPTEPKPEEKPVQTENKKIEYFCGCPNKVHYVPIDVDKKIRAGGVFNCKVCKQAIQPK